MKNVLVFPCGSEVGLEVNRALTNSTHFSLYGASSVDDHGKFVYERYIPNLPFIDAPNFIEKINKIVEQYSIDFIIPTHDSAVLKMAENQQSVKATVVTSCAKTCHICRSKRKTYQVFDGLILTPHTYNINDKINFPVFLKPDVGQGAKGTYLANKMDQVEFYLQKDSSLLISEYLPGKEYTVDCFTDRNGSLLFASGRERRRINNGISVNSIPICDARFQEMAHIINKTLSFRGVWFYQIKERSNGDFVLMEVAPRIAGTMALFRTMGVNFAQLSLFDRMEIDVSILHNNFDIEIDRALFARYSIKKDYSNIYIDFDDTIIVNNSVNINIIRFLYQSRNMGKKIFLLSRHRNNIKESLRKFAISDLLFDEIIILNSSEKKYYFITSKNSIFIDDSFAERKEVFDQLKIPVFALDAVESLLTWQS